MIIGNARRKIIQARNKAMIVKPLTIKNGSILVRMPFVRRSRAPMRIGLTGFSLVISE
jgi:hypothetical protein